MEFTTKPVELQMASFDQTGSIKNLKELKVGSGENAWIKQDGQFFFGDKDASKYIEYDGTDLNVSGTINILNTLSTDDITGLGNLATLDTVGIPQINNTVISGGYIATPLLTANNIQTGTLTGVNIVSSSGANKVQMTNGDILEFYYGGSRQGYIRSEASGNMRISADDNIDFRCDGSVRARVVSAGIMPAGDQTHDLGRKGSPSDRVWRNIYGGTFYGGSGAKKGETQVCRGYVSGIRRDGDELQARYTELEFIGGIFSRYGDESGWFKVADF